MKSRSRGLPSIDEINRLLSYDSATGILTWRERTDGKKFNSRFAGKTAGNVNDTGYIRVALYDQSFLAHRIIWKLMTGEEPETIDHINGSRSDNRFLNLRAASNGENLRNRGKNVRNSSGFKGVYFSRAAQKYAAQIGADGKVRHLGLFATAEDAGKAYAAAAAKLHGDFANVGGAT